MTTLIMTECHPHDAERLREIQSMIDWGSMFALGSMDEAAAYVVDVGLDVMKVKYTEGKVIISRPGERKWSLSYSSQPVPPLKEESTALFKSCLDQLIQEPAHPRPPSLRYPPAEPYVKLELHFDDERIEKRKELLRLTNAEHCDLAFLIALRMVHFLVAAKFFYRKDIHLKKQGATSVELLFSEVRNLKIPSYMFSLRYLEGRLGSPKPLNL